MKSRESAVPQLQPRKWFSFHDWRTSLLVFAGSLLIRLTYLFSLGDDPWVNHPIVDEIAYRSMALAFINGAPDLYPFFRPPLWPMLLSLWYLIVGTDAGFFGIRILSSVISSVAMVSGFRIAEMLFGRRNAWISTIISAACGVALHLHTTGLATSLFTLLTLEAVRLTLHSHDHEENPQAAFPAGLMWGLSALARPNALAGAVISAIWLSWPILRRTVKGDFQSWSRPVWLILGVALVVSPITMLNWVNGDDASIISTNGGINFYLGNNPFADGLSPLHPDLGPDWAPAEVEEWSAMQAGKTLKPSGSSTWYFIEGFRYWIDQPVDATKLWLKKLIVTVGGTETSNNGDWRFFAERRWMLQFLLLIGFWWIAPVGFVGFLVMRRDPRTIYLGILVAVNILVISAFFVASRFRVPLIPLIIPFTVHALWVLTQQDQRRRAIKVGIASIILILGLNLAVIPFAQQENHAYGHLVYGMLYTKEKDQNAAVIEFSKALEYNSYTPMANLYLGEVALERSQFEPAIEYFQRENVIKPKYRAYRGMGIAYRQIGEHDSARIAFGTAFEMNASENELRLAYSEEIGELALQQMELEEYAAAAESFRSAIRIAPENPFFSFGLAGTLWLDGEPVEAEHLIDSLLTVHPDFIPAQQWKLEGWRP
jgi:Dolichyl-phosphate-mannose-protein mannosyltransferase/Tetratricopeptide repeat